MEQISTLVNPSRGSKECEDTLYSCLFTFRLVFQRSKLLRRPASCPPAFALFLQYLLFGEFYNITEFIGNPTISMFCSHLSSSLYRCYSFDLPIIPTRAYSINKMVKPIIIPHYDLPLFHLRYKLCCRVAVSTHPQVFYYPQRGSTRCTD